MLEEKPKLLFKRDGNFDPRRKWKGRCLRAALLYVADFPDWKIVHASISPELNNPNWRIIHAWNEKDGYVWDATTSRFGLADRYHALVKAEHVLVYYAPTARTFLEDPSQEFPFGPWEEPLLSQYRRRIKEYKAIGRIETYEPGLAILDLGLTQGQVGRYDYAL